MIRTKRLTRRELNLWEKTYLPAVVDGLRITLRHFFENMTLQTLRLIGFKRFRGAVTYQYPEEQRPLASRARTRHRLTQRADGSPRCVACMMCETVCPARCINIVAKENPDPNVEKMPASFDLDLGMCVYCGFCVEACPEDAIRMDTRILDISAYTRDQMKLDLQELLNPGSRKPPTVS